MMLMIFLTITYTIAGGTWGWALYLYIKNIKELTKRIDNQHDLLFKMSQHIEKLNAMFIHVENQNSSLLALKKIEMQEKKIEEKKLPPANRKPRTEEQKRLISEQKKAYWANKKAQEAALATPAPAMNTP